MKLLSELFDANRRWAEESVEADPGFFARLKAIQTPQYFWIGCSDSRVPANQITGLAPGEVFVHRNVGNVVVHTDLNCLSVLQYAVDVLGIRHVMVVGHYDCGGIKAALAGKSLGLIDNWLRHIQDVAERHAGILDALPDADAVQRCLSELNVIEQVRNVARTTLVGDAWRRDQKLALHGWIYDLGDGNLRDLDVSMTGEAPPDEIVATALDGLRRRYGVD
ncbi:MAG: carbonate dehydratase [Gammaproteobacteria bacterium]|nr:carbonate dehydratase [Gammaproteobacteria bacterium]MBU1415621.1 carbonate dehydratase [Gammaproteobacteria bacterium]